ncbi:hypothetical protein RvY_15207 [Ramazzottius varieornatus]|uniref:Uncharacterized protein n=1 Tax=Ramazzottius varieornatus TaxID=947166 RepID=A0A1D1VVQ6_RAMVA|nr:hypothetical protein RvY_15207 [Ramazzottius varieornatus]
MQQDTFGPSRKSIHLVSSKCVFSRETHVQKPILQGRTKVNFTYIRAALGKNLSNKEENGFFWGQLDALSNDPHELRYGNIAWHQVFPLVDLLYVTSRCLFHNNLNSVGIFRANLLTFLLPLNERMHLLEFPLHLSSRALNHLEAFKTTKRTSTIPQKIYSLSS